MPEPMSGRIEFGNFIVFRSYMVPGFFDCVSVVSLPRRVEAIGGCRRLLS